MVSFSAPQYGSVIGSLCFVFLFVFFFKSRTLLSSGKEGILFSFLNRKCKLRNEFPVLSLLVINSS